MRIAVLTSLFPSRSFPLEGVFAERRWCGMQARGHAVDVVHPLPRAPFPLPLLDARYAALRAVPARERRADLAVRHPRYLHLPRLPRRNARAFARVGVAHVLDGTRPDAVVCDYAWPAAAAAPALREAGVPCVVSGRGSDVLQVAGEAGLAAPLTEYLRAAGHWCAVSEHLLGEMDRLGGGRGALVPNGIDTERFRPGDAGAARAGLGLAPDGALVLVVGHLIPRKDPRLALEVFARGAPAGARLAFVGAGPLRGELERAVAERGLGERVTLAGEAPPERLADWYRAADCLLLTSRREGRPNVVLEALASGLPVVATDAGGTAELLRELPELLPPAGEGRDPERLAARLAAVLASPPEGGRLRVAVLPLSWERSLDALEACIAGAVEEEAG